MREKLNKFAKNITSQHGEDGILEYILANIPEIPKVCVDIGAWDGKNLSNIYSLWHNKGWKAILIEGDEERCVQIGLNYKDFDVKSYCMFMAAKGENSIDSLFKKNNLKPEIGVISIDIDSFDYHLWKYMSYVTPSVVIIEHNHTIPAYIDYNDPEGIVFLRCSAKALERLGIEKGYRLICCTLTNSIFIKEDLFNMQKFPDLPVEALFDYSSCAGIKISGFTNKSIYHNLDVFYGTPALSDRLYSKIKKFYHVLNFSQKPSSDLINYCSQKGITVL